MRERKNPKHRTLMPCKKNGQGSELNFNKNSEIMMSETTVE